MWSIVTRARRSARPPPAARRVVIPKNCRMSVAMIGKYYASHIENMLDATAINIVRPKRNRRPGSQYPLCPAAPLAARRA